MTVSLTLSGLTGLVHRAVAIAALTAILVVPGAKAGEPHSDDMLDVVVDRSRLVKMPERVATIVIGNPLIADASLQAGGLMVLTGKGYGTTNLIAQDSTGAVIGESLIRVEAPNDGVIIDGFPRTKVQVECLKMFYHAMLELHGEHAPGMPQGDPGHHAQSQATDGTRRERVERRALGHRGHEGRETPQREAEPDERVPHVEDPQDG